MSDISPHFDRSIHQATYLLRTTTKKRTEILARLHEPKRSYKKDHYDILPELDT